MKTKKTVPFISARTRLSMAICDALYTNPVLRILKKKLLESFPLTKQ